MKRLLAHKIEVADFLLGFTLLLVTVIMWYFKILNPINAFMWISGVCTILVLQKHSIPKLLEEIN